MKNFEKFVALNKDKLFAFAEKNTKYNSQGRAVISRNDSWFYEDEWDEHYKELVENEKNSSAGSLVR